MSMFYNMIHNRALENTKGVTITPKNHKTVWYPAWFNAAKDILAEFEAEGLEYSAKEMRQIIDLSEKSVGYSSSST